MYALMSQGLLVTGMLSLLTGCQGGSAENPSDSNLNIVGGQLEAGHPEVLRALTGNNPVRVCTGVVISEDVMLMAGHCVNDQTITQGVTVETSSTAGQKLNSKVIVGYNALRGATRLNASSARYDLAAVVYPKGTFKPPYAKLATTPAKKGDLVKLVGFGASSFEDAAANVPLDGRKRSGHNTLIDSVNGLHFLEANIKAKNLSNNAVAAFGDSGGPVYRNGEFVGIVAGLYFANTRGPIKVANDASGKPQLPIAQAEIAGNVIVDLQSAESKGLIEAATKGNPLALDQSKVFIAQPGDDYLAVCFGGGGGGGGDGPLGGLGGGGSGPLGGLLQRLLSAFGGGGLGGGQVPEGSGTAPLGG
jgi:V8-like Glu-specific endopeptidase